MVLSHGRAIDMPSNSFSMWGERAGRGLEGGRADRWTTGGGTVLWNTPALWLSSSVLNTYFFSPEVPHQIVNPTWFTLLPLWSQDGLFFPKFGRGTEIMTGHGSAGAYSLHRAKAGAAHNLYSLHSRPGTMYSLRLNRWPCCEATAQTTVSVRGLSSTSAT